MSGVHINTISITTPKGMDTDSEGNLYVCNFSEIYKLDSSGNTIISWFASGYVYPYYLVVDSSSNFVYATMGDQSIQKFDLSGNYITAWGSAGSGDGQFASDIYGIYLDSLGYVYVTDWGNNRVQKFDSEGGYICSFGEAGVGDGQFDSPWGIAINSLGNVYISDYANNRIQIFAPVH